MKKIISFSLYGDRSEYNDGAIENVAMAQEFYPGWVPRFYCEKSSPAVKELCKMQRRGLCEVVKIKDSVVGVNGMFWRFWAFSDPKASHIIIRDLDSRVNMVCKMMTDGWINSDKMAYRCHPGHATAKLVIVGNCFGIKGGIIKDVKKLIHTWINEQRGKYVKHRDSIDRTKQNDRVILDYGADQVFLQDKIWPIVQNSCLTYGVLGQPIPKPLNKLPWGSFDPFVRVVPGTNNTKTYPKRIKDSDKVTILL